MSQGRSNRIWPEKQKRKARFDASDFVRMFQAGVKPLLPFDDGWYSGWMRNKTECPHPDGCYERQKWFDGKILGLQDRDKHDGTQT